ncbi:MAG: UPF0721 transmembrane protein [Melioribacteraceae bacterium]|nr:MAG: UPF0721 transmembrane protein [Melioribacteraceae bacterium]
MQNHFIVISLIIFLASFVQGFSGFGFALISIPLLTLFISIKVAVPLGALCGLVVNIYLSAGLKNHFSFRELSRIILGSIIGIPIGVGILKFGSPEILKNILGLFVLAFVTLNLVKLLKPMNVNHNWGYLAGLLSGFFGGAFNTNGPPVLIYFFLKGWDKVKQKAMISGFFLVTSSMIVVSHFISGMTTSDILFDFVKLLPIVLLGIWIGNVLFSRVSTELFNKLVLWGLLVIGGSLILA